MIGHGAISFRRLSKEPFGPPNGGDGGNGGSVYLRTDKDVTSLNHIQSMYSAGNGQDGRGKDLQGKRGVDLELVVPVGTIAKEFREKASDELDDEQGNYLCK